MRQVRITACDEEYCILDLTVVDVPDDVGTLIITGERGGLPITATSRTIELGELGIGRLSNEQAD
jgi:hypothetical protein